MREAIELKGQGYQVKNKSKIKKANTQPVSSGRRVDYTIDFMGKNKFFAFVSFCLVVGSLAMIMTRGLNYGIDFAGGIEVQVQFSDSAVGVSDLRSLLESLNLDSVQVQQFGNTGEFLMRFESPRGGTQQEINQQIQDRIRLVRDKITTTFPNQADIRRIDSVGPQVGDQLKRNGALAVFYSLLLILIYVGLRFDYNFAPGAVVCLFHDSLITLGIFSFLGKEINIQILAAILTIIGYSLNDTIVIFDRIRENLLAYKNHPLPWVLNRSINDALSRTLLTTATTLLAVLSLNLFAGEVIADFAFALGIGVVVGTYSSIYIASPLVIEFARLKGLKKAKA